jgi:type I restriction enzyme M protein
MSNGSAAIVQEFWNYCNVLRDAGLSYGDYLEQLTYMLFGSRPGTVFPDCQ